MCNTFNPIRTAPAPPATYLRITVQIHLRVCWKNLTFPNHLIQMAVCCLPYKIFSFGEKSKVHQKYQNFIRGDPLWTRSNPSSTNKKFQSQAFFLEGSGLPNVIISLILLKVVQVMIFNIECPHNYVHDNGDGTHCVCLRPKLACNLWQLRRFMGTKEMGTGCNLSLTLVAQYQQ